MQRYKRQERTHYKNGQKHGTIQTMKRLALEQKSV